MDSNYGKWIKHRLIEKGMTQKELAEIIGYTRAELCRIVTGKRTPHRKAAMKIQEVLGKYEDEMFEIGDEVIYSGQSGTTFVVTHIESDGKIGGIGKDGIAFCDKNPKNWSKTGRYFPEAKRFMKAINKNG